MRSKKIHINPQRLQWCLESFDMTLQEVADKLKIALQTLEKAMNEEEVISVRQLEKLAQCFDRGLSFFINPAPVDEEKLYPPQFRTINNKKPIKDIKLAGFIERVERQRQIFLGLLEDLELPISQAWSHVDVTDKNIKEIAVAVREWLQLDAKSDFQNLREQLESKGVMVIVSNSYNGKWQIAKKNPVVGFSLYYDTLPVIVVKKQDSKERQSFTLLHELAHLLLHRESVLDEEGCFEDYRDKEKEANEFASYALIPDAFLARLDAQKITNSEHKALDAYLEDFRKEWHVSKEAILMRLLKSGRIEKKTYLQYKSYKQDLHHKGGSGNTTPKSIPRKYRYKEPLHIFGKHYVNAVFDALSQSHITLAKASTYLDNLKINQIKDLRNGL